MSKPAKKTENFQFRVSREWVERLESTIQEMEILGRGADRTSFVRETVEMEVLLWHRSPYVCDTSDHYVLVTADGSYVYLRREELLLRADLQSIPAHLEMQAGKRVTSNLWTFNAFVLRNGDTVMVKTDQDGTTTKSVLFDGPFIEGGRIQREGFFVLNNYIHSPIDSRNAMESLYGRAEFEIDIPTRKMDILVVVDQLLYEDSQALEKPALKFDIRNRDGVAFSSADAVNHFLREANITRIGNFYEHGMEERRDNLYRETLELAKGRTEEYVRSLDRIKDQVPETRLTVEQIGNACGLMRLPERFLFYRVIWTAPHIGLTCSIRFPKPRRVGKPARGSATH